MRSVRSRLLITLVGLVALTSIVLGVAAYVAVATSLRDQQLAEARAQTNFNVAVLADEQLSPNPTKEDVADSGLMEAIQLRGGAGTVVDFGDGDPMSSGLDFLGAFGVLSDELRSIVDGGSIGYERLTFDDRPLLVMGAGLPGGGPDFYFFFDSTTIESAIGQLGRALLIGAIVLVAIALLAGGALTRTILRPVREAGVAAEQIADGDLSARLTVASGDEFGAWARSFNRMAASLAATIAELRTAQDRQRAFVADVSHELRTPLTALVQEAGLLRDHLDTMPPDERRIGEMLVADVGRLRTLVEDLMEISRFDADAERLAPTEFELRTFLRAVVSGHAPQARLTLAGDDRRMVADRRRLERILANLLDNAREHGAGSSIEVSAREDGPWLRIDVSDRGPGVSAEDLPRLFDRFHKGDPSRHFGGSGLGLAIARENAELLGGTLEAALRDGGGMRFELRLPVTGPLPAGDDDVTGSGESGVPTDSQQEPAR